MTTNCGGTIYIQLAPIRCVTRYRQRSSMWNKKDGNSALKKPPPSSADIHNLPRQGALHASCRLTNDTAWHWLVLCLSQPQLARFYSAPVFSGKKASKQTLYCCWWWPNHTKHFASSSVKGKINSALSLCWLAIYSTEAVDCSLSAYCAAATEDSPEGITQHRTPEFQTI